MNKINKMGKRFVALIVVFASIMSFLPIQFGSNGQAAKAIDSSATDIEVGGVSVDKDVVNSSKKPTYSTQKQFNYFNITVKNQGLTGKNKELLIDVNKPTIIDQEVMITSIDRISIDKESLSTLDYNNNIDKLASMGIILKAASVTDKTGIRIDGLPLGVNEITYKVKVIERTLIYQHPENPSDKTTKIVDTPSTSGEELINIEHGNSFVQDQIPYIDFKDYVGGRPENPDTALENNMRPFQYVERMNSAVGGSLRFNHYLSNSVTDMDYKISFPSGLDTTAADPFNDIVFVNGNSQINIDTEGSKILKGSLKKTSTSTIMLLSIRHKSAAGEDAINATYAIEIQYNNKDIPDDYALKDAGVTKYNYNSDSTVKAFVGKEFTTTKENGISIYDGTITIDKLADMVNMKPTLGRDSSATVFKISNHYDDKILYPQTGGDGKPYINFHAGISNVLWLEVWEGKDGNVTGKQLAIYKLKVILVNTASDSTVDFTFDSPAYLTQPGRTDISDAIPFSADRRTYDLHSQLDDVTVNLVKPSSHDEYIRAWGGTSIQSDSVTEIADLGKLGTATINTRDYKKIILQAYYDEIVYKKDSQDNNILDGNGNLVIESQIPYPIGQKYIFYIAKNAGTTDPGTGAASSDATLSNIKASNGNIKSTDNINYSVKVPKIDTSSGITVTTNSNKVKDISATIVETGGEYSLTSGESFDFPLNTSGTTNIKVVVTAEDGINSKTYYITITNDSRSASALLKNVVTDNGDFTFDPAVDPNKIRVDQIIKKIKVVPIAADSKSKITVNGIQFSGTPITIDLAGSQETDMTIKVISEDGSDSKTYTFEIYRTDAALENPDDNTNKDDVFYDEIDGCWVDTSKYEEWGIVKGKDVYFNNKGRQVKEQWVSTKNTWYYLDSKGYKASGWRKDIGGKSYYLDPATGALKTGWMNINNKMYYLGLNGVMHKGWLYLNKKWYYFTPEGQMLISQSMFIDDKVYNFGQDGSIY